MPLQELRMLPRQLAVQPWFHLRFKTRSMVENMSTQGVPLTFHELCWKHAWHGLLAERHTFMPRRNCLMSSGRRPGDTSSFPTGACAHTLPPFGSQVLRRYLPLDRFILLEFQLKTERAGQRQLPDLKINTFFKSHLHTPPRQVCKFRPAQD